MSGIDKILNVLRDPPPEFVFEIAADGIAMSRTRPPAALQHAALPAGIIEPSPVKENILDPVAFAAAVSKLTPAATGRGKRGAALILPDNAVRIAVLDFDNLPDKEAERRPLINFRLRKSVPFDIDDAALSYFPQTGKKVIVVLTPAEIVAHYEAPFRAAGLQPGLITVSSLAMLDLLPVLGSLVLAHRSPGSLTVMAISDGIVTIARSLEIGDDHEEIISGIFSTLAFIEDQAGMRPARLFTAGFGEESERLSAELEIPVVPIVEPYPGLAGYLRSLALPVPPEKQAAA